MSDNINPAPRGTCKYCGAAIRWVRTENGGRFPINPDPVATGNVIAVSTAHGTRARVLNTDALADPVYRDHRRYLHHAATCPNLPARKRRPERSSSSEESQP